MLKHAGLTIVLLAAATAGASSFPLGIDSSKPAGFGPLSADSFLFVSADSSGAVYLLGNAAPASLPATTVLGNPGSPADYVLKLAPDGSTAYLTVLPFAASGMAVDSAGNVFLVGQSVIAKLNPDGSALAYQFSMPAGLELEFIATDNAGHAYAAGYSTGGTLQATPHAFQPSVSNTLTHSFVVRMNTAGSGFDFATYVAGSSVDVPSALAVDSAGAVLLAGTSASSDFPVTKGAYLTSPGPQASTPFLAHLSADGSTLLYSTYLGAGGGPRAIAADASGNATVYQQTATGLLLEHFNPQGSAVTFAKTLPAAFAPSGGPLLAMDGDGNSIVTGFSTAANYPLKNSVAECGTIFLSVWDPSGNLLQSTYLPGTASTLSMTNAVALGPNSTVYVTGPASAATGAPLLLTRLSPASPANPLQLACIGNAGSYATGPVAAGEIVSLFGQGLGPPTGTQPAVESGSGFPTEVADVQVTFDGTPAPLIYVQDGQINAIAPWKLIAGLSTKICVSYNGNATNCLSRSVAAAAPGVLTVDGVYAAALNQDGTVNSAKNPAAPGSVVSIFATGLGGLSPLPVDGEIVVPPLPTNVLPVMMGAYAGGIAVFEVLSAPQYAGPAPFEVAGVSQINCLAASQLHLVIGPDFQNPTARSASFRLYVSGQ